MKKSILWLTVILWLGTVILAGCNKTSNEEVTYNQDSWKEIISEDCQRFFDGCNFCSKAEDWEAICTEMFCEIYKEPKCTDDEFMDEVSDEEINSDEEVSEEANNEEVSDETNNEEVSEETNNEELPVAKMRISDDLTQE